MSKPWDRVKTLAEGVKSRVTPYSIRIVWEIKDSDGVVIEHVANTYTPAQCPNALTDAQTILDRELA